MVMDTVGKGWKKNQLFGTKERHYGIHPWASQSTCDIPECQEDEQSNTTVYAE